MRPPGFSLLTSTSGSEEAAAQGGMVNHVEQIE